MQSLSIQVLPFKHAMSDRYVAEALTHSQRRSADSADMPLGWSSMLLADQCAASGWAAALQNGADSLQKDEGRCCCPSGAALIQAA